MMELRIAVKRLDGHCSREVHYDGNAIHAQILENGRGFTIAFGDG
jgi:hypothetical protein